jgi:hypothetical protein
VDRPYSLERSVFRTMESSAATRSRRGESIDKELAVFIVEVMEVMLISPNTEDSLILKRAQGPPMKINLITVLKRNMRLARCIHRKATSLVKPFTLNVVC